MIGRYGGCFEEDIRRLMCDRAYHITGFGCTGEVCTNSRCEKGQCTVPKRLANCGKVRVRIIHGLTLVIKNSHTYCKSLLVIKQSIRRMLLGERLVGVNHRSLPTLTQRMTIIKQIMLRLRYITVHHTCMLRESQTLTQVFLPIHNYSLA